MNRNSYPEISDIFHPISKKILKLLSFFKLIEKYLGDLIIIFMICRNTEKAGYEELKEAFKN